MALWARWVIRAVVSAAVIAVLLAVIPLGAVGDALSRVSAWTWAASVAIFFAGHYLNAFKLQLLLGNEVGTRFRKTPEAVRIEHFRPNSQQENEPRPRFELRPETSPDLVSKPRFSSCLRAQYAGLVANLALPGLAGGDVVRAVYLAPSVGIARVTAASIADRLIDTVVLVGMIAVALLIAGVPPVIAGVVGQAGLWIAIAIPMALAGVLVVRHLIRKPSIAAKIGSLRSAFSARASAVAGAVAISLAVQSAFVMTNVWLARQVGVTTALAAWFVAWPLSKLVSILPLSLGGIGVREAALVSLLVPYGASGEAVLASGILWQSVLIVTGLAGLAVAQLLPGAPGAAPAPRGI